MKLGRKGAGLRRYMGKLEDREWGRFDQNTSIKILKQNKPFIMYACEYQWTICGVQFFVSVCGLWGSNLGLKASQQVSLPTEVS